MKAITLYQPWAQLIAIKAKTVETRSWNTQYTGPLAIHAGLSTSGLFLATAPGKIRDLLVEADEDPDNLPLGCMVATSELMACLEVVDEHILAFVDPSGLQRILGDLSIGRYAWMLDRDKTTKLSTPVPVKGHQGLWYWDPLSGGVYP